MRPPGAWKTMSPATADATPPENCCSEKLTAMKAPRPASAPIA
jgi:hypothetical protein